LGKINRDTWTDALGDVTSPKGGHMPLSCAKESEFAPFLLLFFLFITGFGTCAGGMIFIVLAGRLAATIFVLFLLIAIVEGIVEARKRWTLKNHTGWSRSSIWNEVVAKFLWKNPERWAVALGWWLPRKHREAIVGDILEDCHEMRENGLIERRIWTHVLWQWATSIITLLIASIVGTIARLLGAK
jgi:hypothetical protein